MIRRPLTKSDGKYPGEQALEAISGAAKNTDARLVRIEYNEGNRAPVAKITANKTVGAAPLKVRCCCRRSMASR